MKSSGERERFASVIGDKGANEGADGDERVSYSELVSLTHDVLSLFLPRWV